MKDPREIKIITMRASSLAVGDVFRMKDRGTLRSEQRWIIVADVRPMTGRDRSAHRVNGHPIDDVDLVEVHVHTNGESA